MWKSSGLAGVIVLGGLLVALQVSAGPRYHVVYSGQRLGSIAKRYNLSVEDLCDANGINPRDPIKPGQKLTIPQPGEKIKKVTAEKGQANTKTKTVAAKSLTIHTVYAGQRLASIAKRYRVTLEALCFANDLSQFEPIKPGQKLVIPQTDDVDGRIARRARPDLLGEPNARADKEAEQEEAGSRRGSTQKYIRSPKVRGYVTLIGYSDSWKGHLVRRGKVEPSTLKRVSALLGAEGSERVAPRLLELLAQVSDTFGGRPIRVVSGFREFSYVAESRHKTGHAIDFSIPGVPNSVVRDYLRKFKKVGVGYYPNSSFVHFDVRGHSSYWVDYAGPGQPPRLTPNAVASQPAKLTAPQQALAAQSPEVSAASAQQVIPADPDDRAPEGAAHKSGATGEMHTN